MLPVIRKSLLLVLAMLQLVAPLVHAHIGDSHFNHGLHIPGLEPYLKNQDAPVFQNVNVDWESEGLLIVVDAGIKNPQDMIAAIENGGFALPPSGQLRADALPENDSNFSPPFQSFSFRRFPPLFSPRAPPAQ